STFRDDGWQAGKPLVATGNMIRKGQYVRDVLARDPGSSLSVHGWVRTRRDSKAASFIQLNDGSSARDLQVVIEPGAIPADLLRLVTTGASVRFDGTLVPSPAKGQTVELKASAVEVFGPADPAAYPLQKKGHSFEFLREIAHLRPRSNTFNAVFRVRNALCRAIHDFFQERGFLYIHPPVKIGMA